MNTSTCSFMYSNYKITGIGGQEGLRENRNGKMTKKVNP